MGKRMAISMLPDSEIDLLGIQFKCNVRKEGSPIRDQWAGGDE